MTNPDINLGLDALTDDQLVEIARAVAAEVAKRSPAVLDASRAAIAEETERAAHSQDQIWTIKKWLAVMVSSSLGKGWSLNVWLARDRDDTRVYLEQDSTDRRGRDRLKYCLHVTGNNRHAPGTLTVDAGSQVTKVDAKVVRIICQHAHEAFPGGVRIDCDRAAALHYDIPAMPGDLAAKHASAS